ncbi:MAG: hypothetical protein QXL77_06130 [Candidatus Bathyarchaeia archaeon]
MGKKIAVFFAMLIFGIAVAGCGTCLAADSQPSSITFEVMEIAEVSVNCTTAQVTVECGVISTNATLVHFPAEINMNATELKNATQITLVVSTSGSVLYFVFNNTEAAGAEKYANVTVETYFEQYFGLSFTHHSTSTFNGYVNVTFTGIGVGNLTEFTQGLMGDCLIPDLGGFSQTFVPITKETGAYVLLGAFKESGDFKWTYTMGVAYSTIFPDGSGEHTVDVLDMLNVELLAPSDYAFIIAVPNSFYASTVVLDITSDTTVTFISCVPDQTMIPYTRGWYIDPSVPSPTQLIGTFFFGGDNTPVTELSLTFSGVIIPEFTAQMCMAVLMLISVVAVAFKKRFNS